VNDVETLRELYRHMEWADAIVWSTLLAAPAAAEDATLRERLYHIHMVQFSFLRHWRGLGRELDEPAFPDAASLARWGREFHGDARQYLASVGAADLVAPSVVPWTTMVERHFGRKAHPTTLGETLLQVAMHSAHHRGQVSTRLREVGCEPPITDFIAWVWFGKPEAAWPDVAAAGAET
jgi:uncharacterized damage-inducible protein DinB